jgi:heme exporter protein A
MSSSTPAVETTALVKQFGRRAAVSGIDLTLAAGACLAVFGPNGAGKTTLLRLIAGLLRPTTGSVRLHGIDVRRDTHARARVGLISHQSMLYAPLTALENVVFSARLYGLSDPQQAARDALAAMGMLDRADVAVRTLSRGLQQRVSIARATVHDPTVVLLDEPYSGLDEGGASALTTLLHSLRARGGTLVLVTHNLSEGLALASHAAIMRDGAFVSFETRESGLQHERDADAQRYATEYRRLVGHVG